MELNRDTRKEMARLAREAQELWEDQRGVFMNAKKLLGMRVGVLVKPPSAMSGLEHTRLTGKTSDRSWLSYPGPWLQRRP